jgi:hypothetical protein
LESPIPIQDSVKITLPVDGSKVERTILFQPGLGYFNIDATPGTVRRADIQKFVDFLGNEDVQRDPKEVIDAMASIVPGDAGLFRNVVPKAVEEFVKTDQKKAWKKRI